MVVFGGMLPEIYLGSAAQVRSRLRPTRSPSPGTTYGCAPRPSAMTPPWSAPPNWPSPRCSRPRGSARPRRLLTLPPGGSRRPRQAGIPVASPFSYLRAGPCSCTAPCLCRRPAASRVSEAPPAVAHYLIRPATRLRSSMCPALTSATSPSTRFIETSRFPTERLIVPISSGSRPDRPGALPDRS